MFVLEDKTRRSGGEEGDTNREDQHADSCVCNRHHHVDRAGDVSFLGPEVEKTGQVPRGSDQETDETESTVGEVCSSVEGEGWWGRWGCKVHHPGRLRDHRDRQIDRQTERS